MSHLHLRELHAVVKPCIVCAADLQNEVAHYVGDKYWLFIGEKIRNGHFQSKHKELNICVCELLAMASAPDQCVWMGEAQFEAILSIASSMA